MRDLRAYACTFADCNVGLFEHREDWFKHELEIHRRIWICPSCTESNRSYDSATSLRQHLQKAHPAFSEDPFDQNSILDMCSRPIAHMPADSACPLCDDYERGNETQPASTPVIAMRDIKKHLADHQEQLALFAVPRVEDDGDAESNQRGIDKHSLSGQPESNLAAHTPPFRSTSRTSTGETASSLGGIRVHSDPGWREARHDENGDSTAEAGPRRSNYSEDGDMIVEVTKEYSDDSGDVDATGEMMEEHSSRFDIASEDSDPQVSIEGARRRVKDSKHTFGEGHPETLDSMSRLALLYRDVSQWQDVEKLHLRILKIRKRTLGEMHPHTLDSMSALASTLMARNRLEISAELHLDLIDKSKNVFGEEHPITLGRMRDLACMFQSRELYEQALDMEGQVHSTIEREFGPASPDAIDSKHRMSLILRSMGRKDDAFALISESAKLSPREPGADRRSLTQSGIIWPRDHHGPNVLSRVGKKGKTRMPKCLVHRDVLNDLDYQYDEEEGFFVVRSALGEHEIDEVVRLSGEVIKPGTILTTQTLLRLGFRGEANLPRQDEWQARNTAVRERMSVKHIPGTRPRRRSA
jgi:hypothetical protein